MHENPLAALIQQHHPNPDGYLHTSIPGLKLLHGIRDYPRAPLLYEPGIVIVAQGRKVGYHGGGTYCYDPENYLVMSVPLPFECETFASETTPLLALCVAVDVGMLRELLLQMEQCTEAECNAAIGNNDSAPPSAPMASVPLDASMRDVALRLLSCLNNPLDTRMLGPQLVRELIYRVLCGRQGDALRAVAGRHSGYSRLARALRRIHTEYATSLDVDTLAREANMSVSTFHHNFKAMTLTSPLQYIKSVRLHKAWLLMVQDGVNASTAAGRVGYESASQFSREFKRYFGRSPVEEASAARL